MARKTTRTVRYDKCGRVLNKGESQRDDGRYMFQYTDPVTKKRGTVYADTLNELRQIEEGLQQDIRNGISIASLDSTVNQFYDSMMADRKDLKESSLAVYSRTYDRYIRESFGKNKLKNINSVMIERFYNQLVDAGLSENTLCSIHTQISQVTKQAARHDLIRRDYSEGVCFEVCKRRGIQSEPRTALDEQTLQAFFDYALKNNEFRHYIPILQVLLLTGCRIGEVLAITLDDIDFDNNVINITKELVYIPKHNGLDAHLAVTEPKSKAGKRVVPIADDTRKALKQALLYRTSRGGCKSTVDGISNFVFVGKRGTVMWSTNVNKAIRTIVKSYNEHEKKKAAKEKRPAVLIPSFSCHSLRHTFTARVCEAGINPKLIQKVLGHKDITTTLNVYADIRKDAEMETFNDEKFQNAIRLA